MSAEFDSYREVYEPEINAAIEFSGQDHEFFLRVKADHLIEFVSESGKLETASILDVGCGNGAIHKYVKEIAPTVSLTGVDPAEKVIEEARLNNPEIQYFSNNGTSLPFPDDSFDFVTAVCVMHHVPPPQWKQFLEEAHRVLKPGGNLLVYEHNPFNPVTRHIVKKCPLDANAVLLKPNALKNLFIEAGFELPSIQFLLFFPGDRKYLRKAEQYLTWFPIGAQYVSIGGKSA